NHAGTLAKVIADLGFIAVMAQVHHAEQVIAFHGQPFRSAPCNVTTFVAAPDPYKSQESDAASVKVDLHIADSKPVVQVLNQNPDLGHQLSDAAADLQAQRGAFVLFLCLAQQVGHGFDFA